MTITLDEIKAEQTRLAKMIETFETQATAREAIHIPEQTIELDPGEHYAGIITGQGGEAPYHLILMAAKPTDDLNFEAAGTWAKQVGGSLPSRREQALLYANLKDQFDEAWYWSSEPHAADADYAWYQDFYDGNQNSNGKAAELRARAVRRLTIE